MFDALFRDYWWLLFPLVFMTFGLVGLIIRNEERRRIMRLIKSYTDQGKDVPVELLNLLKS